MIEERRRHRVRRDRVRRNWVRRNWVRRNWVLRGWVLPVLLVAGAGTVVALRTGTRPAGDGPAVLPAAAPTAPRPAAVDTPADASAAPPTGSGPAADAGGAADPAAPGDTGPAAAEPAGPGSAAPLPDGSAPGPEFTIKGNGQSKLYHPPTSPYYGRTRAEVWFRTAEDAEAAGFRAYRSRHRS